MTRRQLEDAEAAIGAIAGVLLGLALGNMIFDLAVTYGVRLMLIMSMN
jgi:high-affinity Fe2+/Pb2+ permease